MIFPGYWHVSEFEFEKGNDRILCQVVYIIQLPVYKVTDIYMKKEWRILNYKNSQAKIIVLLRNVQLFKVELQQQTFSLKI